MSKVCSTQARGLQQWRSRSQEDRRGKFRLSLQGYTILLCIEGRGILRWGGSSQPCKMEAEKEREEEEVVGSEGEMVEEEGRDWEEVMVE